MKKLIVLLILVPVFSFSQTLKSYGKANLEVTYIHGYDPVYGIKADAGLNLANKALLGIGAGLTKFKYVSTLYVPVFANIAYNFNATNKIFPMLLLQPGYGIYSRTTKVGITDIIEKGGFTWFAGGGIGISSSSRIKTMIHIGYAGYTFKTNNQKNTADGFAVKVGVAIL